MIWFAVAIVHALLFWAASHSVSRTQPGSFSHGIDKLNLCLQPLAFVGALIAGFARVLGAV